MRGLHNGTVPLGYHRVYGEPGDPRNGELVVDERTAETVRVIFREYGTGRYSMPQLARHLNNQRNADGSPQHSNRNGEPLTKALIADMLPNPVYVGKVVWHPGRPEEEVREGRHEAIVTQDLFDRVVAVRARQHRFGGRRSRTRINPFSPVTRCWRCRGSYPRRHVRQDPKRRLRHTEDRDCPDRRSIRYEVVDRQFAAVLEAHFQLPDDWQSIVLKALRKPDEQDSAEPERRRLQKARDRLGDLYVWGELETRAEYEQRKDEIEAQLELLPLPPPAVLPDLGRAAELLTNLGAW